MTMQSINYKDLDLKNMKLNETQGSNSKVYVDGDTCYKIFNPGSISGIYTLEKKIKAMEGLKINGIILPKDLVIKDNKMAGYSMDYVPNSTDLTDHFGSTQLVDVHDILVATAKASHILEEAHENGMLLCDVSFNNVLINRDTGDISICDIDNCQYQGYKSEYASILTSLYYKRMRCAAYIDENFDRQAMLLAFLATIYCKLISNMEDYDTLSDKIQTLSDLRFVVEEVLYDPRAQVPYLYEFINEDEHFIIDRNKQCPPERTRKSNYYPFI